MEEKITSVDEYRKSRDAFRLTPLPSGAVFKIRKITSRDYLNNGGLFIKSTAEITKDENPETVKEKQKLLWEKLTAEEKTQQLKTSDNIVVMAVVDPPISLTKEEGKLQISDIADGDYYALLKAITDFSYGGQDPKSFRTESTADSVGHDSEKIQEASVGTA